MNFKTLRHQKFDIDPLVVVTESIASGEYWRPEENHLIVDEKVYNLEKGIILINPDEGDNTIFHEYRHHQQRIYGHSWEAAIFNGTEPYKKEILRFFSNCFYEMDALIYSLNNPDYYSQLWFQWLIESNRLKYTPRKIFSFNIDFFKENIRFNNI